jgi:hypothetical protein
MWRQNLPSGLLHTYFVLQSLIVIYLLSLPPHLDFIDVLFILLSYQVALVFPGKSRWAWCGIFIALIIGALIKWLGVLPGIAYSMTPVAGCIIFPVYVIANREEELAILRSQEIVSELQEKHRQLELRARWNRSPPSMSATAGASRMTVRARHVQYRLNTCAAK